MKFNVFSLYKMVEIFVCISFKLSSCAQDVEIVEKNQQHRISQYPGMEIGQT